MTKKNISEQELRRNRVYEFYNEHKLKGKYFTFQHFQAENIPKSTIYKIIKRADDNSGHQRIIGSGRVAKILTKKRLNELKSMIDHKSGISQRQIARKFGCSQQHISETLKRKTTIKYRKKKKIPARTEFQKNEAKKRCGRLYLKFLNSICVMDDESYFTLSNSNVNSNAGFYSSNVASTSVNVKYWTKTKFEKKLLVYIAFSEKGISKPFFLPSGLAVNQKVYKEDCLQKILIPFLKEYHSDNNYLFWPDLASAHYAKSVVEFYEEQKVNFVEKQDNPANLPECRPIEDFWGILKGLVYKRNWSAENINQLKQRIVYCLKNVDINLIQNLARSVTSRLDNVRRNGVIENQ